MLNRIYILFYWICLAASVFFLFLCIPAGCSCAEGAVVGNPIKKMIFSFFCLII